MDTRVTHMATIGLAALLSLGCSLVTEFDPAKLREGDGGVDLYSLAANIDDPVDVVLLDNGNASIEMTLLTDPLPDADDATLLGFLNDSLQLTVENQDTGVNVNLTQGTRTDEEPSAPGEYRITVNEARDQVTVLFRNETVSGQVLREEGDYQATVSVTSNSIFEIEDFVRDVNLSKSNSSPSR